jgi:hypothetical protein
VPQQLALYDTLSMNLWYAVDKGDPACRALANRHYTRQNTAHPMWTRPGYNFVLYSYDTHGQAAWCWWRPKWEAGVERMDGLRVLECTLFRNETHLRSSLLITDAVEALTWPDARACLHLEHPFRWPLLTGINSEATARRRSRHAQPGHCFRAAGWHDFAHRQGRADVWLTYNMPRQAEEETRCQR